MALRHNSLPKGFKVIRVCGVVSAAKTWIPTKRAPFTKRSANTSQRQRSVVVSLDTIGKRACSNRRPALCSFFCMRCDVVCLAFCSTPHLSLSTGCVRSTLVCFPFGLMVVFQQPSKQKENKQHNSINFEPPIKQNSRI